MNEVSVLAMVVIIAVVYLLALRLVDLNEQEPLWAIGLLFALGAFAGTYLWLLADPRLLTLNLWGGRLLEEVTRFVAIAAGVAALTAIGRLRGWSELNGTLDGILYGAAAGLGMATGGLLVRLLTLPGPPLMGGAPELRTVWVIALVGLSQGLFGAVIGAGFGMAIDRRHRVGRALVRVAGLPVAVLLHVLYEHTRTGMGLTGRAAITAQWAGLLLPIGAVVALVVYELTREQAAIVTELADEAERGVVTAEEFALLRSLRRRRATYLRLLLTGRLDEWAAVRDLHNRQVQLALAEQRARRATGGNGHLEAEIERIREAILDLRASPGQRPETTGQER